MQDPALAADLSALAQKAWRPAEHVLRVSGVALSVSHCRITFTDAAVFQNMVPSVWIEAVSAAACTRDLKVKPQQESSTSQKPQILVFFKGDPGAMLLTSFSLMPGSDPSEFSPLRSSPELYRASG